MWFESPHDQKWHFVGMDTDRCFTCGVKRPASPGHGQNAPPHAACAVCLRAFQQSSTKGSRTPDYNSRVTKPAPSRSWCPTRFADAWNTTLHNTNATPDEVRVPPASICVSDAVPTALSEPSQTSVIPPDTTICAPADMEHAVVSVRPPLDEAQRLRVECAAAKALQRIGDEARRAQQQADCKARAEKKPRLAPPTPATPAMPFMAKPTPAWARSGQDGLWHYMVHRSDTSSFCGAAIVLAGARVNGNMPPKGAVRCRVCNAKSTRRNEAWSAYRQQQKGVQGPSTNSAKSAPAKPSVQPPKGHVPPSPLTEADMFLSAVKSLSSLGQRCRNTLEEKRCGKRPTISGVVKQAHSTVEQWQRVCTKSLAAHPPGDAFWKSVIVKYVGPDMHYTRDDLSAHIEASLAMFRRYMMEEQAERAEAAAQLLAEAAQRLSTLLTAAKGVTYQQAFQQLPTQMKEAIAQSVKRKEWSETLLSLAARRILLAERVAAEKRRAQEEERKEQKAEEARRSAPKQQQIVPQGASYWDRYGRQGTQAGQRDSASNSESGVIGNPTHRRW
jgi:hypothetical protein